MNSGLVRSSLSLLTCVVDFAVVAVVAVAVAVAKLTLTLGATFMLK